MTITPIPASTGAQNVSKPRGAEAIFVDDEAGYAGKVITVKAGKCLPLQFHHKKSEPTAAPGWRDVVGLSDVNGREGMSAS